MLGNKTKRTTAKIPSSETPARSLSETPSCSQSRGKEQRGQKQLDFGDENTKEGGKGDGKSATPRRSAQAKDVEDEYSSNEDAGREYSAESDGSDKDVAVSSSAKKRKKRSAQLLQSSSDEEGQPKRRGRIIIASNSSDSLDDGCTEINKTVECDGQPNSQHCADEVSSSMSRRARASSLPDQKKTALEKLMKQRARKQQGINKSMYESEDGEEEEEETEVISSESEDDFIVPDDEIEEEEEGPEVQEDEDSVGEIVRVHQDKKTQFQSWVELMLCANLQDNPGEYLRTAWSNSDIPKDTRDNVNKVQHRLQVTKNLVLSQAWKKDFKDAIKLHPIYTSYPFNTARDLDCQACRLLDHPRSYKITLKGTPYNSETFEDDHFGNYEKSFDLGNFCKERSKRYHGLYHFSYNLFHTCKKKAEETRAMLRDEGEEDPDNDEVVIRRCLQDQDWIDELFKEMEGRVEDAHQQYTTDGRQKSQNRRN